MSLSDEHREYTRATLEIADLEDDPIVALRRWIDEAIARNAPEPNAMILGTVDPDGAPSTRVVLCKEIDAQGLHFYTSYASRKGRVLAHESRASACLFWPTLERQVRVDGQTTRLSRAESTRYFHSRPRGSQLAALASRQSAPLPDRATLETEVARLAAAYPSEVPLPAEWGGYALRPIAIEFWQGRPSRLHDRIAFHRASPQAAWQRARLSP